MAVDAFLILDGIKGETLDHKHKDAIEIMSFSWGCSQTGSFQTGTGGGAGKVHFNDLSFSTHVNKGSPLLALHCASGQHIKKGMLVVRKAGKDQHEYYKITLADIIVTSYQSSGTGSGGDSPHDSFSLNFANIKFEYAPQKADGSLEAHVAFGWDLKANKSTT
jgi:type VI secretion system secreted protein Hcp